MDYNLRRCPTLDNLQFVLILHWKESVLPLATLLVRTYTLVKRFLPILIAVQHYLLKGYRLTYLAFLYKIIINWKEGVFTSGDNRLQNKCVFTYNSLKEGTYGTLNRRCLP